MTLDNAVRASHVSSLHPVFPPMVIQRSCLEVNRPMPRLKVVDKEPVDQRDVVNGINNPHRYITVVYMTPFPSLIGTSADAPQLPSYHSLTFWPLTERDAHDTSPTVYDISLHPPSMGGFSDLRRMPPNPDSVGVRYLQQFGSDNWMTEKRGSHVHWYPLRFPGPPSSPSGGLGTHSDSSNADPGSENWDPRTLTGLWLGAYHTHGTEVLYIEYDEALRDIQAWKVTGDCNVPRGVITWRFGCAPAAQSSDDGDLYGEIMPTDELLQEVDITEASAKAKVRMYAGEGTISLPGYL